MPDLPLPKPQSPAPGAAPTPPAAPSAPTTPPPSALVSPPPAAPSMPSAAALPATNKPSVTPVSPVPAPGLPSTPTKSVSSVPTATAIAPPPAPPGPPRPPVTPPPSGAAPALGAPKAGAPVPPQIQAGGGKQPIFAQLKQSPFKLLPIVVGVVVVIGLIIFLAMRFLGGNTPQPAGPSAPTNTGNTGNTTNTGRKTTLTYWGLWEPSTVFEDVITEFEAANPTIDVNYVQQRHPDYRERLQTAIASQNGPDLFRFHASWTPMLAEELSPMPNSVMSVTEYRNIFYPVAAQQLQINGQIIGIPLMYDGLALYYNKDIFTAAGLQPPKTWAELKTQAAQLTVRSSDGIERAGAAIGNASNVEHFSDIIGLLMLQNGADLTDPTSKEAQEALQFYTNFVKVDKVWSEALPSSTTAFARGDVAMMFAPSWRAHEVLALNPDLNFGITTVPSLGADRVAWASYWAEGVSAKSANKDDAWKLLKFLSQKEIMQKLYDAQAEARTFGEPYSRTDMADLLASDPYVASYLADAPYATDWYLNSYTHDNGINDLIIKYYLDAVNAVLGGKTPADVMATVAQGTSQVLRQYNLE